MRRAQAIWRRLREFSGLGNDATYLWPRWIFLRAVGLVFIIVFAGIIDEGQVLVGPRGLTPLADFFLGLREKYPSGMEAFLRAPSLFWTGDGAGMIAAVAWGGLIAAGALVLNLWPRMALFACWLGLLSFVTTWGRFSASQVDQLMLEVALLAIPFAPAGLRPGLGLHSPPRPIALFAMRWLLFRVMFESGLVKLLTGDPHWRNFTAMEIMYETSPFPTVLGYYVHHFPRAIQVVEIGLTYAAELVAPLLAAFGGRRGRWVAFGLWVVFQTGIQFTNNFGWLNLASIALGLLLLDDQMFAAACDRLRLNRLGAFLAARAAGQSHPVITPWRLYGLRAALTLHFVLTLYFFGTLYGRHVDEFPYVLAKPLKFVFEDFHSANPYTLYSALIPVRHGIEFEGSNDGGETWRTYEFRYQPQRVDRIGPFIAPWYPRLETTLHVETTIQADPNRSDKTLYFELVAAHLLEGDPAMIGRFQSNPFPDRPPTIIRMSAYQLKFTSLATHRETGAFWQKEPLGEYLPLMYLNAKGEVAVAASGVDEVRVMAAQGNARAQGQLGSMYVNGDGVAPDQAEAARWFRKAAEQGLPEAQNVLGLMYAAGAGLPKDEVEALAWFHLAARAGNEEAVKNRDLAESQLSRADALKARMRSEAISAEIDAREKPR